MNFNFDFLSQIDWQSLNTWLLILAGLIIGWLIEWLIDILYFRRRRGALVAKNAELSRQLDTVRLERNRETERAEAAVQRVDLAESDASRLRDDLEAITQERDQTQAELSLTNRRMSQLDEEVYEDPALRRRAEQAETRLKALEGDLAAEQERARASVEGIETLKLQRNQLEQRVQAMQAQIDQAPAAQAKPDTKLQDRLAATEAELTRLSDENDLIRTELETAQAASGQLNQVEAERNSLLQRLQNAEDEIAQLQSQSSGSGSGLKAGAAGAVAGGVLAHSFGDDADSALEAAEMERINEYNKRVEAEMRVGELENTLNEQKLHAQHLEEKLSLVEGQPSAALSHQQEDQTNLQVQLDAANSRIAALQGEVNELRKREVAPGEVTSTAGLTDSLQQHVQMGGDDFLRIHGIGHVFARRLHEAGINSFSSLGSLSPADVEKLVQPQAWQIIDASDWIRQAQTLSGGQA